MPTKALKKQSKENTTALVQLTKQEAELLAMAQQEMGGARRHFFPKLKISGKGTKTKIPEGHFYVVVLDKEAENGVREIDVGENPEILIMKRLYSYSWYSKAKEKLLGYTNEFDNFTPEDEVIYVNCSSAPFAQFRGNYPEFKAYKDENLYDHEEQKSKLRFTNVLYVYLEHPDTEVRVFKMMVGNASAAGIPEGEDRGDFKNPEPTSLIAFLEGTRKSDPTVFFGTKCRLDSYLKRGGIEYYVVTFENVGAVPDVARLSRLWFVIGKLIDERFKTEFLSLPTAPGSSTAGAIDVGEVEVDDLPDLG